MLVIVNHHFPPGRFLAINILGVIFARQPLTPLDRNHEYIHTLQQRELLFLGFYLIYIVEWLWHLCRLRSHMQAYYAISFEREAYEHGHDLTYPKRRRLFSWLRYWGR